MPDEIPDRIDAITETDDETRPRRTPGRRRPERGLPSDEALRELARTYLQAQRSLWPDLVKQKALPAPDVDVIAEMADQFRRQFFAGAVSPFVPPIARLPWDELATSYLRYSCDNSNPRSLDQQLQLQLERARRDGRFIPWPHVFADAAVTGTTADRRGYEMAKQALGVDDIKVLYIDEIGRASRDAVEALRLGRLVERKGKRLIGVSDGFDSAAPTAKLMLSIFATLQEWFIDQLRSKVNRGMDDAFRRGTNLHPPSLGFKLEPAVDVHGHPIYGKDGERLKMKGIDDQETGDVLEAFPLFGLRRWSRDRIARMFNEKCVGGKQAWDARKIGMILRRYTYIGIEIYRQTYQVRDPETGTVTVKQRPRKEWRVRRMRHLQIVPWKLWKIVQRRLEECRSAYAERKERCGPTRTELYPKVLIRPICGSCGSELMLGRSGRYASLCCLNGVNGKHGCSFKGYKSVRIVDAAILNELHRRVVAAEFLERLVTEANRFLIEEAGRPREDVKPLEAEIRSIQAKRDRLVEILDREGDADLNSVVDQVRRHERRVKELRIRLDELKARNAPPPPTMTHADVETMLADLRSLLEQDVAAAAPVLKELTGPIVVDQVAEAGKARPTWVARFTVNAVPVLARLAASRDCPTRGPWEYLNTRDWTMVEGIEVRLEHTPLHEALATTIAALASKGTSVNTIARATNTTRETVRAALAFGRDGGPTASELPRRRTNSRNGPPAYVRIADEVARLRDQEQLPFTAIARRLGVSHGTATSAYDWAHRAELAAAAQHGETPRRGRFSYLGPAKHREILERLESGQKPPEVAAAVGCSVQTAYRALQALRNRWRDEGRG